MSVAPVIDYVESHKKEYLAEMLEFLRIPSISTLPERAADVRNAAEWVAERFRRAGLTPEIVETERHPIVLAETGSGDPNGVTVLVYGHYDVQPTGDLNRWESDPFDPQVRGGAVYARGSADDKGQFLSQLLAVEAWLKTVGSTPVNVKFLVEGEEEISSPSLPSFFAKHGGRLACDYVVISDTFKLGPEQPAITCGTKGLVYKEINITGPKQDLHSGSFGGTVANPANVLAELIAGMKDADGRVLIDGFYDDVAEPSKDEQETAANLDFSDERYKNEIGTPELYGEKGYTTIERRWYRPTLDVNGLYGGFAAAGANTIIPSTVGAKISMRIVPNQDPAKVSEAFDRTVRRLAPNTVKVDIVNHGAAGPYVTPADSPGLRAGKEALEAGFGKPAAMIREGGTLPILNQFQSELGADCIMLGYALPTCGAHGPNEFFVIDDFYGGVRTNCHFLERVAALSR
jgi:acetylornithine deacetylase/succinyl-diaminopimelate desuccinylase-like protein